MKETVPETLKEALKLIEKQKQELQKKDSELQKQQEEIIKARAEIERLNEQLAIKRAREFAARSEKSSHINSDQKELPFDIENQTPENAVKEKNSESYGETEMAKVRVQVSERIVHVPGYEYIEVIEKEVYECPNCVNDDETLVIKIAGDRRIIERSIATPELLAHVFMGKYQRHTPFYC